MWHLGFRHVLVASRCSLGDVALPHHSCCGGYGQRMWVVANGDGDDDVMVAMRRRWWGGGGGWASSMVVVEEEGIDGLIPFLSFRGHSFHVIPRTIPVECEFCSTFHWNTFINLAGNCAKIDSYGIPGIDRILPDSGRNQWRTVKTSSSKPMYHCLTRQMGWLMKEQQQTAVRRKMRTRLAILLLSPPFDA